MQIKTPFYFLLQLVSMFFLIGNNVTAQSSRSRTGIVFGADFSYNRVFNKGYADEGIKEVNIFGYAVKPKILFETRNRWSFGATFMYLQFRDNVNDTLLFPNRKGIGLVCRKSYFLSTKRNILLSIEPQIMLNNYSPISKSNYSANYTKHLIQPQLVLNIMVSKVFWQALSFNAGFTRSYFPVTKKLFLIRPGGFISLEYNFNKHL